MHPSEPCLSPAEAASRLGVSIKALRLYERHGLLRPARSAKGWRAYGPVEMARAAEVTALRGLGLGLAQVARLLQGGAAGREAGLAAHQAALSHQLRQLAETLARIEAARAALARPTPALPPISLTLPWPWGGEVFELPMPRPLTYIIGPLGSGKTRLGRCLAATIPGAAFLEMDRQPATEPALCNRVERALAALRAAGATDSPALRALLAGLEAEGPTALVIDMVEQGLDAPTQAALRDSLRRRGPDRPPLFLLTRSSVILDLETAGPGEAILLCPANHSPPREVSPCPGAPGHEAVATCLAPPEVRARTEGMIAFLPQGRPKAA